MCICGFELLKHEKHKPQTAHQVLRFICVDAPVMELGNCDDNYKWINAFRKILCKDVSKPAIVRTIFLAAITGRVETVEAVAKLLISGNYKSLSKALDELDAIFRWKQNTGGIRATGTAVVAVM